jgi:integrase
VDGRLVVLLVVIALSTQGLLRGSLDPVALRTWATVFVAIVVQAAQERGRPPHRHPAGCRGRGSDRAPDPLHGQVAEALVFLSRQGKHLRRSNFNRRVWQPATQAAGVEGLRVHDLRHTAGTLATAAGGSLREVMDRLGHSTTVAAMRYQHIMTDQSKALGAWKRPGAGPGLAC